MKKCKITVMRKACYKDLMEKYENPMEHACDIEEGQVFITNGWCKPVGMCDSAWESIPFHPAFLSDFMGFHRIHRNLHDFSNFEIIFPSIWKYTTFLCSSGNFSISCATIRCTSSSITVSSKPPSSSICRYS